MDIVSVIVSVLLRLDKEASELNKETQTQEWLQRGLAIERVLTKVEKDFGTETMTKIYGVACNRKGGTINPMSPTMISKLQTAGFRVKSVTDAVRYRKSERAAQEK